LRLPGRPVPFARGFRFYFPAGPPALGAAPAGQIPLAKLKAEFLAARRALLERFVAMHAITQAEANRRLAQLKARLNSLPARFAAPVLLWRLRLLRARHLPPAPLPVP
jgi:hypothetical protein